MPSCRPSFAAMRKQAARSMRACRTASASRSELRSTAGAAGWARLWAMMCPSGGRHGGRQGLVPRRVEVVGDRRVAVDQRAAEQRVRHAADLMLDLEEQAAVLRIDDVDEAVLVLAVLAADQ